MIQQIIDKLKGFAFFDTLKHTGNYFGGTLMIQALGLISLPVYTYFLTPSEYGIAEMFLSLSKMAIILFSFNAHSAVSRYYFEEGGDYKSFLGTIIIAVIAIFTVNSILFATFFDHIQKWANIPANVLWLIVPFTFLQLIHAVFNMLFAARKESFLVSKLGVGISYTRFVGALIGILSVSAGYAYFGKIVGDVIAAGIGTSVGVYYLWPHIKWAFSWKHLKYSLMFGLPLIPFSLNNIILIFFDQWMINGTLGNEEAGLYSFAYKIGMLLMGFNAALQAAAVPDFYKWMNNKEYDKVGEQVKSMVKLQTVAALGFILFAADLGYIITFITGKTAFNASLSLIPILVVGFLLFGLYEYYGRQLFYAKKTLYLSIITLLAGIVNILLNIWAIPKYQSLGAAYTTLASTLFLLTLGGFICTYILKMPPLPVKTIGHYVGVMAIFVLAFFGLTFLSIPYVVFFGIKGILIIAYVAYAYQQQIKRFLG